MSVSIDNTPDSVAVRVAQRRRLTDRVDEFTLEPTEAPTLPAWTPGAHVDLSTPAGPVRQYSLCSDPANTGVYRVAIEARSDGRGGSESVHRDLVAGAHARISRPRNHFPLTRALGYVFVAGGIGITPLISLIEQAQEARRPWRLIYVGKSRARMPYVDDLVARFGDRVAVHESELSGRWDPAELAGLDRGSAVYACGPAGLLAAIDGVCTDQPAVDVFVERFTALADARAENLGFEVTLAFSGRTLTVPPHQTVLDVLDEHGIPSPASCREGMCGTCETGVVSGEVDHRDSVLTPEERAESESMMVCVSRCTSGRLVLEL